MEWTLISLMFIMRYFGSDTIDIATTMSRLGVGETRCIEYECNNGSWKHIVLQHCYQLCPTVWSYLARTWKVFWNVEEARQWRCHISGFRCPFHERKLLDPSLLEFRLRLRRSTKDFVSLCPFVLRHSLVLQGPFQHDQRPKGQRQ